MKKTALLVLCLSCLLASAQFPTAKSMTDRERLSLSNNVSGYEYYTNEKIVNDSVKIKDPVLLK